MIGRRPACWGLIIDVFEILIAGSIEMFEAVCSGRLSVAKLMENV
jgi:hypothetical protein